MRIRQSTKIVRLPSKKIARLLKFRVLNDQYNEPMFLGGFSWGRMTMSYCTVVQKNEKLIVSTRFIKY